MHSPDYLEENNMIAEDVLSQQILSHKVLSIFTNLLRLKHKHFTLNRKRDRTCVICKIIQYWMRKEDSMSCVSYRIPIWHINMELVSNAALEVHHVPCLSTSSVMF